MKLWLEKYANLLMKSGGSRFNGRNRTAKSGMHQNASREGKLELLENIGSERHQANIEEKELVVSTSEEREKWEPSASAKISSPRQFPV